MGRMAFLVVVGTRKQEKDRLDHRVFRRWVKDREGALLQEQV